MPKPTKADAEQRHARLCTVPAMPHRGPSRERRTILLEALGQAYTAGLESAAEWHEEQAANSLSRRRDMLHSEDAKAIRALGKERIST